MTRKILLVAALGLVVAGPAMAQTANSTSNSGSNSTAQSGAQSGSVAGAQIITNNSVPAQTSQTQRYEGATTCATSPTSSRRASSRPTPASSAYRAALASPASA